MSTPDNTIGGTIGGTVAGAPINGETPLGPGNIIAYSETAGISIAAAQNVVQGNFIGTDLAGDDLMKGNSGAGIILDAAGETLGGTNTFTSPGSGGPQSITQLEGNVIGYIGTGEAAISISGTATGFDSVIGNYVGVDPINPKVDVGNAIGIAIGVDSVENSIGGPQLWTDSSVTSTQANIVGFNVTGIQISGPGATYNIVQANYVGTEPGGYNLGNEVGIDLDGVSDNLIGGNLAESVLPVQGGNTMTGAVDPSSISGNIIGFNSVAGVVLAGSSNE